MLANAPARENFRSSELRRDPRLPSPNSHANAHSRRRFVLSPGIPQPALVFATCLFRELWGWLKVRFRPSAELKIDMLSTSIGSCIRSREGGWVESHYRINHNF